MFAILNELGELDHYASNGDGLPDGWSAVELPPEFDPEIHYYADGVEVDHTACNAEKIAQLNKEREARMRDWFSEGAAKAFIYSQKIREAKTYGQLSQVERDLLTYDDELNLLPFLRCDADEYGDGMNAALARFEEGIASNLINMARMEARYQAQKTNLIAAPTVVEKDAVMATWQEADATTVNAILKESGDRLLLENGDVLRR